MLAGIVAPDARRDPDRRRAAVLRQPARRPAGRGRQRRPGAQPGAVADRRREHRPWRGRHRGAAPAAPGTRPRRGSCWPRSASPTSTPTARSTSSVSATASWSRSRGRWDGTPRILILDEPTATLNETEIEQVFLAVRGAADHGCAVIFVSHRLGEVLALCARVMVMRDGANVLEAEGSSIRRPTWSRRSWANRSSWRRTAPGAARGRGYPASRAVGVPGRLRSSAPAPRWADLRPRRADRCGCLRRPARPGRSLPGAQGRVWLGERPLPLGNAAGYRRLRRRLHLRRP